MDELINAWEDPSKTTLSAEEIRDLESWAVSYDELEEPYETLNFKEA